MTNFSKEPRSTQRGLQDLIRNLFQAYHLRRLARESGDTDTAERQNRIVATWIKLIQRWKDR